jgi:hypothetical protein
MIRSRDHLFLLTTLLANIDWLRTATAAHVDLPHETRFRKNRCRKRSRSKSSRILRRRFDQPESRHVPRTLRDRHRNENKLRIFVVVIPRIRSDDFHASGARPFLSAEISPGRLHRLGGCIAHTKLQRTQKTQRTQRTQKSLNFLAEGTSSRKSVEAHSQAFSFAFFAPSRETNLLSKFAPNCECVSHAKRSEFRRRRNFLKRRHEKAITSSFLRVLRAFA